MKELAAAAAAAAAADASGAQSGLASAARPADPSAYQLSKWAMAPIRVSVESALGVDSGGDADAAMGFAPIKVTPTCWVKIGWLAMAQNMPGLARKSLRTAYDAFDEIGVEADAASTARYFISFVVADVLNDRAPVEVAPGRFRDEFASAAARKPEIVDFFWQQMLHLHIKRACRGAVAEKSARAIFFAGLKSCGDYPHPDQRRVMLQEAYHAALREAPLSDWRVLIDEMIARSVPAKISSELYFDYLSREVAAHASGAGGLTEAAIRNHLQRAHRMHPRDFGFAKMYADFEKRAGNGSRAVTIMNQYTYAN